MAPPVPPAVPQVSAKEFLQTIWGAEKGVAELTLIGSKLRKQGFKVAHPFNYPDSIDSFLTAATNHNRTDNVYMGVCLRREKWASNSRGTEALALSSGVIWAEFDFAEQGHKGRTVPEADARKALYEFPLKPSIIIRSGGGIQVYWLLKELVTGDDLWRMKAVNRALAKFFNADPQSTDLARVLRIPWTKNHNYEPARTVEIAWWHPDNRYRIDDFDFLPIEDLAAVAPASVVQASLPSVPLADAAPAKASSPPPPKPSKPAPVVKDGTPPDGPRSTPTKDLGEDKCLELGNLFAQIWFEGWRHEMALCVASWLAHQGVCLENARAIVTIASNKHGGDTKKRVADVDDTYAKYLQGAPTKGRPTLELMVDESFPEVAKEKAKSVLGKIEKLLPKKKGATGRQVDVDFKILHLIKLTTIPAQWTATLEKDTKSMIVHVENSKFLKYETFVEEVCDQTSVVFIAPLKNHEWRAMIDEAQRNGLYEEHEAPPETRPSGAIEQGLEQFLAEAKENPDIGLLKKFPGYDDDSTFFRIETFREFLEDGGQKFTQNNIIKKLRNMGWESKTKRFGKKIPRVWVKATVKDGGSNGNGHGNGNPVSPPPPPPADTPAAAPASQAPTKDPAAEAGLFPVEEAPA